MSLRSQSSNLLGSYFMKPPSVTSFSLEPSFPNTWYGDRCSMLPRRGM